jgi:hypothetical protein
MPVPGALHKECVDKLSPKSVRVSPKFHAMLGALLHQEWTQPSLSHFVITSDGFVLGCRKGDCGCNDFMGATYSELVQNIRGVAEAVDLSPEAVAYLVDLVDKTKSCPWIPLEA